ncbi:BMC domain-containing protein [Pseudanabaena sp. FACHB-2040]|uniref:BMC domain-containing protein n=1 Tax=Pseudanabaena sp. FACHB-2040 TaxID=2692859 RepID=UPI0016849635|nr:BMC domain-containing protein [Pseudanabaena sp. FACHB-2040]MBD2260287.1 BMC domain-containing protein [Pseudanabaena sp. FACHB-2040]
MPEAVGVIETLGMPTALEAADTLCKSGQVQFVRFDNVQAGLISVIIRGPVSEVTAAIQAALSTLGRMPKGRVAGHHIIPCPDGNLEAVLPLQSRSGTSESADWLID